MGAYGSPELYPYEYLKKRCPNCAKAGEGKFCSECGTPYVDKKHRLSKASVRIICISLALFILCFLAGGRNLEAFVLSAFLASLVSFVGNILCVVLSFFKKEKAKFYLSQALFSMGACFISILLFGLFCT